MMKEHACLVGRNNLVIVESDSMQMMSNKNRRNATFLNTHEGKEN